MKYRVRCIGRVTRDAMGKMTGQIPWCGWSGVRTAHVDCECYDEWAVYCRPTSPGPGCPSGIVWPCPRCGGAVTGRPVQHRG